MKNDLIKQEDITERFEVTALSEEWIIITVCQGNGRYQSESFIQEFQSYDCFLLSPGHSLILVPEFHSNCRIFSLNFSTGVLINNKCDRSALQMIDQFLNSSKSLISFPLSNEIFDIFEHYAAILVEFQNNTLPYSILIHQLTINALLLLLARTYFIHQPPKKQSSKEITSRLLLIENVKYFINQNYSEDLFLSTIANDIFINPSYLSRIFKEITGIGLTTYINQVRITKAKQLLLDTDDLIIDIATSCGFNYIPHFNSIFKEFEKMTPTQFRKMNKHKRY